MVERTSYGKLKAVIDPPYLIDIQVRSYRKFLQGDGSALKRKKEGLEGYGAAVTIFRPEGVVMGVSTDYPYIKVFEPETMIR